MHRAACWMNKKWEDQGKMNKEIQIKKKRDADSDSDSPDIICSQDKNIKEKKCQNLTNK